MLLMHVLQINKSRFSVSSEQSRPWDFRRKLRMFIFFLFHLSSIFTSDRPFAPLPFKLFAPQALQDPSHPPLGPPTAPKSPSHVSGRPFTSPSPLTPHALLTIRRRQPFSLRCEGRKTKSFIHMYMDGQKQITDKGRKNKRKRKERKNERFDWVRKTKLRWTDKQIDRHRYLTWSCVVLVVLVQGDLKVESSEGV